MPYQTSILALPTIAPAQAQKHITHNEALQKLDVMIQLRVLERDKNTPPPNPTESDAYIVGANPNAEWAELADKIVVWQANVWKAFTPNRGWLCWVEAELSYFVYENSGWAPLLSGGLQNANLLGVNASADTANRLSVASDNVLFNHENSDIRIKLNKADTADTTSFVFQTNWTGHAEIGLTGDNDFHFKVSGNGTTFTDALILKSDGKAAQFSKSVGVGIEIPQTFWAYNNTPALFSTLGFVGSNGSYEHGIWWNGYRNNALGWTSMNINGYTSAAGIALGHGGIKFKWQDPPSGVVPADIFVMQETVFKPGSDNTANLGAANARFKQIYAASGTIVTSDMDLKTEIKGGRVKRAAEKAAASALKSALCRYQYNDAIAKKGKRKARIHFGAKAQLVEKTLRDYGLNPQDYGFLCKDQIETQLGHKKEIYGLRYEELLMFMLYYG